MLWHRNGRGRQLLNFIDFLVKIKLSFSPWGRVGEDGGTEGLTAKTKKQGQLVFLDVSDKASRTATAANFFVDKGYTLPGARALCKQREGVISVLDQQLPVDRTGVFLMLGLRLGR